jgi:hypothetical protein
MSGAAGWDSGTDAVYRDNRMDAAVAPSTPSPPGSADPDRTVAAAPTRSVADRRMRRLLLLPPDGPKVSIMGAHSAFSRSIAISATRCLLTYIALPLLAPIVDLSRGVGPALGLLLSAVSMVAIFFAARRFFAADHKWRWPYAGIGAGIWVLLIWQSVLYVRHLLG